MWFSWTEIQSAQMPKITSFKKKWGSAYTTDLESSEEKADLKDFKRRMSTPVSLWKTRLGHKYSLSLTYKISKQTDPDAISEHPKPDIEVMNRYAQYEAKIKNLEGKLHDYEQQNNELRDMVNTLLKKQF